MSRTGDGRLTRVGAALATAACAAGIWFGLPDMGAPWGEIVGASFALAAPAASFGLSWPARDVLGRLAMGVGASFAVVLVVSQVLLLAGTWSLRAGVLAVGGISAGVWLLSAGRRAADAPVAAPSGTAPLSSPSEPEVVR